MSLKIFITATDTDAGKTYVSTGLLTAFHRLNYSTLGLKPLATGCFLSKKHLLRHSDALLLKKFSSIKADYSDINAFGFQPAIAPHIAAQDVNQTLSVNLLTHKIQSIFNRYASDIYIIEGLGGWHVPLNYQETMADFVKENAFSVILVVNIKLGCLNHALLTYQAIQISGAPFKGFIANCRSPDIPVCGEIIKTLKHFLPVPCLGIVNYQESIEKAVNLKKLF